MSCGGLSEVFKADGVTQLICDAMKSKAEVKAGKNYVVFTAKLYKTEPAAGTNYFIKVHVGEEEYVHLLAFSQLPWDGETLQLNKMQQNKRGDDPIVPF
ncbi:cystatin-B-like [Hippoglossus stenolepis]|uniref:cystatin-B-like n=1 Tax=Hippoglossus stenolepis TaxID=195615 RepID=UPI001FAE81AA|nr:cystatin-B-like [Hippoglossus stenolepis]